MSNIICGAYDIQLVFTWHWQSLSTKFSVNRVKVHFYDLRLYELGPKSKIAAQLGVYFCVYIYTYVICECNIKINLEFLYYI